MSVGPLRSLRTFPIDGPPPSQSCPSRVYSSILEYIYTSIFEAKYVYILEYDEYILGGLCPGIFEYSRVIWGVFEYV